MRIAILSLIAKAKKFGLLMKKTATMVELTVESLEIKDHGLEGHLNGKTRVFKAI